MHPNKTFGITPVRQPVPRAPLHREEDSLARDHRAPSMRYRSDTPPVSARRGKAPLVSRVCSSLLCGSLQGRYRPPAPPPSVRPVLSRGVAPATAAGPLAVSGRRPRRRPRATDPAGATGPNLRTCTAQERLQDRRRGPARAQPDDPAGGPGHAGAKHPASAGKPRESLRRGHPTDSAVATRLRTFRRGPRYNFPSTRPSRITQTRCNDYAIRQFGA